jgi:hypothetical protein
MRIPCLPTTLFLMAWAGFVAGCGRGESVRLESGKEVRVISESIEGGRLVIRYRTALDLRDRAAAFRESEEVQRAVAKRAEELAVLRMTIIPTRRKWSLQGVSETTMFFDFERDSGGVWRGEAVSQGR